ncbi:hypothetical protein [Clostridium tunisiense]|uniref:hypothetical protein n=1 Tax=Clostridium tunisiense TaxID=219748 RepID=UPI0002EFF3C3|nr:hypothetical protein [Clostridium tunisiense]
MVSFKGFSGIIKRISDLRQGQDEETSGCYKLMEVENEDGSIVNFIVAPTTYFVNHEVVAIGDEVTGYYDVNAPVPLIYPPQYRALIMVKNTDEANVKVDYFDEDLISSDGSLKLRISRDTEMLLPNGQPFNRNPAERNLIVIYGPSTKSIPAQTTPYEIVVLC